MTEFIWYAAGVVTAFAILAYATVRYLDSTMGIPRRTLRGSWRALIDQVRGKKK